MFELIVVPGLCFCVCFLLNTIIDEVVGQQKPLQNLCLAGIAGGAIFVIGLAVHYL